MSGPRPVKEVGVEGSVGVSAAVTRGLKYLGDLVPLHRTFVQCEDLCTYFGGPPESHRPRWPGNSKIPFVTQKTTEGDCVVRLLVRPRGRLGVVTGLVATLPANDWVPCSRGPPAQCDWIGDKGCKEPHLRPYLVPLSPVLSTLKLRVRKPRPTPFMSSTALLCEKWCPRKCPSGVRSTVPNLVSESRHISVIAGSSFPTSTTLTFGGIVNCNLGQNVSTTPCSTETSDRVRRGFRRRWFVTPSPPELSPLRPRV